MMKTKTMVYLTMLIAVSIVFHLVEAMIPIPIPVPGFKLGLANIVGLITLYFIDEKSMLLVNILRVLLASLMRGLIFSPGFWLSLAGVLLSTIAAIVAKRRTNMSIFGVSCVASCFHVVGQMIMVSILYQQILMVSFLPILLLLSIPTGLLTATLANQVCTRLKRK